MKNKKWLSILLVFGTILVSYLGYSKKFVSIADSKLWPGSSSSNSKTFDHIDIQSVASFTYYVDGSPVNVNINFYDNREELGNVSVYRKNQDGTLTNIPVKGTWRSQTGTFNGIRTEKEFSISGNFDRYYANTTTEVVYLVQFKLNVTIAGKTEELVYSEEYSYNSSNNVCPGKTFGAGQGIDVLLSGNKLQEFFSASLKIVKNVVGAEDNTFTFRVKALNENIDFDKEVQITTNENTGSIILGGLVANESYSITEINIPEGYQIIGENPIVFTASQNNTITKTIVNSGKVVNISGTKTWEDNNDQDGIRPDNIMVRLYADGKEVADRTVTVNDNWTYNFTNMPEYNGENKITYTVKEDTIKDYTTKVDGYNITNTHEVEKTNVKGTKTWEDNNDQDGIRPDFITVRLYADGVEVANKEVTKKDNWTYNFTNLDKFNNGKEIKYTVSEDAIDGYTTTINGFNIINKHEIEKIDVSGTKTWDDNNNQDGIRPDFITIKLYANRILVDTKEVRAKDNWKYSFTNLDKYKDGSLISYTISEDTINGYKTTINGFNVINTHEVEKTNVKGSKVWEDNNNQDGIRPNAIKVNLYADGSLVDSKEVTKQDNWSYEFTNLDKKKNGKEIKYTVSEDAVNGYTSSVDGFNITNTHKVEKTNVNGTKTWEDNNDQDGIRPDNIMVRLYADGKEVASKIVTKKDNWKYSFTNLDKNKDGKEIKYTVSEDAVEGYTTTINGFNITNSYEPEVININGVKTWDDNNNQDGIRPDNIMVRLYADDVEIEKKKVSAQDNWSYEFTNLDKKKNGKEIKYTISEDAIDGYTTTINGFNIVNTHTPETTKVMGKKIWNDNNNQDGIRPDFITVRLYADGEYVAKADITSGVNNDWTYAFIDLPKYNNGKEIKYTVSEDAVDGYNTSYSEENEYIIINTHLIEKTSLNGVKTWDDNNNQDGIRPDSIMVRLYADGIEIANKKVTANDNWKYNFTDLDKYKDGQLVSYTITEDLVKGYSTVIDNNNITNTHEVEKINVSGTKTWDDNNNQDGIRPDFITVNLYGNNELLDSVVVNEESNWTYEFTNLDKYKDGYEIVYDVTEEIVDGYETTIEDFNITNTHIPEKITFKATKVWDDNNNQDGIRQSEIVVKLYKNGELFKEVTINEENNWTYSFVDLDRYENGIEIVYTVVEDVVLGYDTVIDYTEIDANNIISATITNTHIPEKTELNVKKIWLDRDNIMGLRPDNIEVDLYADGNFLKTVVISKDNNWNYLFDNLDKYQNGTLINYTFMEKPVYGYTTTYERSYIINTLDNYIYPENPEILPPQTGVKTKKNTFEYIALAIIGLFIFKQKNA